MDFFSSIIGQDKTVNLIKNYLANNNISHAYLFLGPPSIGKTSTAKAFASNLLLRADNESIGLLKHNIHPDLLIIEKQDNKKNISKDQITKELAPWLHLKPYIAHKRIVIIKDAHQMSLEAANALLRTLEEPPEYAVIILIADQNSLLETIVSRCQIIRFTTLTVKDIEKILIAQGHNRERAYQAARLANGNMSLALRIVNEEKIFALWDEAVKIISNLLTGDVIHVFNSAEAMEHEPELLSNMMETILRDLYIYITTEKKDLLVVPEYVDKMKNITQLKAEKISEAINHFTTLKKYYKTNINSLLININMCYAIWGTSQASLR